MSTPPSKESGSIEQIKSTQAPNSTASEDKTQGITYISIQQETWQQEAWQQEAWQQEAWQQEAWQQQETWLEVNRSLSSHKLNLQNL